MWKMITLFLFVINLIPEIYMGGKWTPKEQVPGYKPNMTPAEIKALRKIMSDKRYYRKKKANPRTYTKIDVSTLSDYDSDMDPNDLKRLKNRVSVRRYRYNNKEKNDALIKKYNMRRQMRNRLEKLVKTKPYAKLPHYKSTLEEYVTPYEEKSFKLKLTRMPQGEVDELYKAKLLEEQRISSSYGSPKILLPTMLQGISSDIEPEKSPEISPVIALPKNLIPTMIEEISIDDEPEELTEMSPVIASPKIMIPTMIAGMSSDDETEELLGSQKDLGQKRNSPMESGMDLPRSQGFAASDVISTYPFISRDDENKEEIESQSDKSRQPIGVIESHGDLPSTSAWLFSSDDDLSDFWPGFNRNDQNPQIELFGSNADLNSYWPGFTDDNMNQDKNFQSISEENAPTIGRR